VLTIIFVWKGRNQFYKRLYVFISKKYTRVPTVFRSVSIKDISRLIDPKWAHPFELYQLAILDRGIIGST
jgi:hypothetical protein